ncbi:DUF3829 domain-containing protein [Gilliamella sp. WF3-4]|uniref:DUF3829 domain-containing protein n=1 Tax=Gilliamella sp. WF3-4 TaxID=3120255 RepID=UPI00080E707B|nr:DUF3829 domain-containing protein [Gilliamella apicola]OCG17043.1 hypothetical protein A9G47_10370 [Gilliamella apicola]
MQKKFLTIFIAGLLMIGCNDQSESKTAQSTTVSEAKTSEQTSENTSQQIAAKANKGNLWLSIFNTNFSLAEQQLTNRVSLPSTLINLDKEVDRYLKQFQDKNGNIDYNRIKNDPTKRIDLFVGSNPSPEDLDDYKQLINKLIAIKPELPELDNAGKVLGDKFVELGLAYDKAAKYYTTNEYKLDELAKLPELFNNLENAYNQYIEAEDIAFIAYDKLYKEIHAFQKAEIKNQGLMLHYNCIEFIDISEEVVALINRNFAENNDFKNLDKSIIEPKIEQLESIANELIANKGKTDLIKKQALNNIYYDRFADTLPQLVNQMKVVLKELQTAKIENEVKSLNGTLDHVIDRYNSVIN